MPNNTAARAIARDIRKNKEARRKRIKGNKAIKHTQQYDQVRSNSRKFKNGVVVNNSDLLMSELNEDSEGSLSDDEDVTKTGTKYDELMQDKHFLFSMQPKMYEEDDSDSEEEPENELD